MLGNLIAPTERFDVDCTIEVENTFESLHAHVVLDGDIAIEPGDSVLVHGEPVRVPYGEKVTMRRRATVTRAGWLERKWTRATGDLEFMELCEFSFSSGREL
ncbi:MAG: hypothetical protein KJ587_03620 [Alphaproteobacteria bacterium]|nr:hypothetical protein [Alphaproteobacteria bacterium]